MADRSATVERSTKETHIKASIHLDGAGKCSAETGVGFLDHMLDGFARHGFFDLEVACRGDLGVDTHHSMEDIGIVLGETIRKAAGDKKGITRYGSCTLPMDETLILCAIDLSGRPYFESDVTFTVPKVGEMDTEMVDDFFHAIAYSAGMNLHFVQLRGSNNHHLAEGSFKAFAKALDMATGYDARISGVLSTKGTL